MVAYRTCIVGALVVSVISLLCAISGVSCAKKELQDKWHLRGITNSESDITNNYVSGVDVIKDSAMVSYNNHHQEDFRKNQLQALQTQIQQQLPKEAKFFDEFEGSEFNCNDEMNYYNCLNQTEASIINYQITRKYE